MILKDSLQLVLRRGFNKRRRKNAMIFCDFRGWHRIQKMCIFVLSSGLIELRTKRLSFSEVFSIFSKGDKEMNAESSYTFEIV